MPSTADVAVLRAQNAALVDLAGEDIRHVWSTLDLNNPAAARDVLLESLPRVTTAYGDATALVAADWYDDVRYVERVPGKFRALMADPFPEQFVADRIRYGAGHLFTATPEAMLPFLLNALQEYVLQPGRDTIQGSTVRDPASAGWQRVTSAGACSFCQMLAGRGGVYKESTAPFAAHGNCACTAAPSWDPKAPEVPAIAYKASERTYRKSPEQLAKHNSEIRAYLDRVYPVT